MLRDISAGNPSLLEAGDDTGDSAADFDEADPTPRNNAGATTTTAGSAAVVAGVLDFNAAAGVVNKIKVSRPGGADGRDQRSRRPDHRRGRLHAVSRQRGPLRAADGFDRRPQPR